MPVKVIFGGITTVSKMVFTPAEVAQQELKAAQRKVAESIGVFTEAEFNPNNPSLIGHISYPDRPNRPAQPVHSSDGTTGKDRTWYAGVWYAGQKPHHKFFD